MNRARSLSRFWLLACTAVLPLAAAGCGGTLSGLINFDGGMFSFAFDLPQFQHDESTEALDLTGIQQLKVVSSNGEVEVNVAEGNDPEVRIRKVAVAFGSPSAADLLDQIDVAITKTGDSSEILCITVTLPDTSSASDTTAHGHGGHHAFVGASLHINLPAGLALDLTNGNGKIEVDGNAGIVKARTTNGFIEVEHQTGDMDLATVNGLVKVHDAAGSVLARCTNGPIILRVSPPEDGSVDAETTNGPIGIRVPDTYAGALDLAVINGRVHTDLTGFTTTDLVEANDSVTATLNGGSDGQVRARTTNGPIHFGPLSADDGSDSEDD